MAKPDLRCIQAKEISNIVRQVEFLDYLAKTRSNTNSVSPVVDSVREFQQEVENYNVSVSLHEDDFPEFAGICDNNNYDNPFFKEYIAQGERLTKWREELANKKFQKITWQLLTSLPRGDSFEKDYYVLYCEIVNGETSTYLSQECGSTPIPKSGMETLERLAMGICKKKVERFLEGSE